MKIKKTVLLLLIMCICVSAVFAGGKSEKDGDEPKEKGGRKFIQIKSSAIGGSWYAGGAAWAKLITDNTDYIAVNSASPGLANETIKRLMDGSAQLGFVTAASGYVAYKGEDHWDGPQDYRSMFGLWPGVFNIIVEKNDNVMTIDELKGKSIATYVKGDASGISMLKLLKYHDIDENNSKIYQVMKNDATRMLIDGSVDCVIYAFGYGHSKLKEMSSARDIRFVPATGPKVDAFLEEFPVYYAKDFGEEFGVPSAPQLLSPYFTACSKDMSNDLAYEFTKVWWDNTDFLNNVLPNNMPLVNMTDNLAGVPIPIHPGAEKYLKEKGMLK